MIHNRKFLVLVAGKELHAFDLARRTWTVAPVPKDIVEIASGGDSLYSSAMMYTPHVLLDDGASWSKQGNPCGGFVSRVFDVAMRGKNEAWVPCKVGGAFVATSSVRYSQDGGRNWTDMVPETALQSFRMAATQSVVLYIDRAARLFSSGDGGRTWKQDTRKVPDTAPAPADGPLPVQAK